VKKRSIGQRRLVNGGIRKLQKQRKENRRRAASGISKMTREIISEEGELKRRAGHEINSGMAHHGIHTIPSERKASGENIKKAK